MFTDISQIKKFIPIGFSFNPADLDSFLKTAVYEKIRPLIGQETLDQLLESESDPSPIAPLPEALFFARKSILNFALLEHFPFGNVEMVNGSYLRQAGGEKAPLLLRQQNDLLDAYRRNAYSALDNLLQILEKNESIFEHWRNSPSYYLYKELFISTAAQFNQYIDIAQSRYLFNAFVPTLRQTETQLLKPLLGSRLFDHLKTAYQENSLKTEEMPLLELIKPFLCHYTYAKAIHKLTSQATAIGLNVPSQSENASEYGHKSPDKEMLSMLRRENQSDAAAALQALKNFLQENVREFPLFEFSKHYVKDSHQPYFGENTQSILVM